jgi:hypothetical protein
MASRDKRKRLHGVIRFILSQSSHFETTDRRFNEKFQQF